jgi:hypothetical protein
VANTNHNEVAVTYFKALSRDSRGNQEVVLVRIFDAPAKIGNKYFQNKDYIRYLYVMLCVGFKMEYLIWNAG